METRTSKRLRLVNKIVTSKKMVQWLPDEIWDFIFLNYCDFTFLVQSRVLQSKHVRECTESNNMLFAIESSNFNNMKWIYQCNKRIRWSHGHFKEASERGDLKIMKWLKEKRCPWDAATFAEAARHGDLENMKWLKENGCPWSCDTFSEAALCGILENMKWLKMNACPWDYWTFAMAEGDLDNMKWLKKNGCPWSCDTFKSAAENWDGISFEILEWLRINNCPSDEFTFEEQRIKAPVREWLESHSLETYVNFRTGYWS